MKKLVRFSALGILGIGLTASPLFAMGTARPLQSVGNICGIYMCHPMVQSIASLGGNSLDSMGIFNMLENWDTVGGRMSSPYYKANVQRAMSYSPQR